MVDKIMTEILASHADQINEGTSQMKDYIAMFPDRGEELQPLLTIAGRLKKVLAPAKPEPAFRHRLRDSLVKAAEQRLEEIEERSARARRRWRLIRAATLGSVLLSLVGVVVAFILRHRPEGEPQPVASP
ncbi:MAG: hypothetical protein ACE5NP_09840 [Anaerolineae bacterium]